MHLSQVTGVGNREVPWNTHSYSCDHGDRKLSAWLGRKMVIARTSSTAVAVMRLFAGGHTRVLLRSTPDGQDCAGRLSRTRNLSRPSMVSRGWRYVLLDIAGNLDDAVQHPEESLDNWSTGSLSDGDHAPSDPVFVAGRVLGTDQVSRFSSVDSREVSSQVNARKSGFSHLTSPVAVQSQLPCFQIGVLDLTASNGLCWVVAADAKRNTRT